MVKKIEERVRPSENHARNGSRPMRSTKTQRRSSKKRVWIRRRSCNVRLRRGSSTTSDGRNRDVQNLEESCPKHGDGATYDVVHATTKTGVHSLAVWRHNAGVHHCTTEPTGPTARGELAAFGTTEPAILWRKGCGKMISWTPPNLATSVILVVPVKTSGPTVSAEPSWSRQTGQSREEKGGNLVRGAEVVRYVHCGSGRGSGNVGDPGGRQGGG